MIKTREELKEVLKYERSQYYKNKPCVRLLCDSFIKESCMEIWKYQRTLRLTEYHFNNKKNPIHILLYFFSARRMNRLGIRLGIYIPINVFEKGLKIDHYGSIVINGLCRIGKNCRLHGNNCIGNKGEGRTDEYPVIGDNFDLGTGASVIGGIRLGNNIKVGANAVVTHSCLENGAILVGVPAKNMKVKEHTV